jgi:hypothetical protein
LGNSRSAPRLRLGCPLLPDSEEEADRRFEETIRRMAKMPSKPQEEMKLGKPRHKQASSKEVREAKVRGVRGARTEERP